MHCSLLAFQILALLVLSLPLIPSIHLWPLLPLHQNKHNQIMVQSLLKSLFLYGVLATSAVLAAPAHQHESAPLARGISPRQYLQSPHPLAAGLTVATPETIGKRSPKAGGRVKKVTNAIRLANALPPLPPRKLCKFVLSRLKCTEYHALIFLAALHIETIDEGSRAGSAHKARSSPLPPVS